MTNLEIVITLLALLGDDKWIDLEIDQVEWTNLAYGHQN